MFYNRYSWYYEPTMKSYGITGINITGIIVKEMRYQMKTVITDPFWLRYRSVVRHEMIPYQWKVLNDEIDVRIERERDDSSIPNEKSHALENFRIAAGIHEGHHYGWVFQDSDVYKWLEAVAYSLMEEPDESLKRMADSVVDLIAKAQEEDGYLGTYFTIEEPYRRFKSLMNSHELYCAGHFMEAAAAYYEAVGNQKVLDVARRLADCIEKALGPEGEFGYDGHEEIEIGLMKLYHLTGEERYMRLSRYFLRIRGTDEDFFGEQKKNDPGKAPLIGGMDQLTRRYFQIHRPPVEQDTAEGHAVRLVYLCTAMADVAASAGDREMLSACRKIWRNIVDRRMYITGGIGSTVHGEAFTFDYDLPNDTMYCETCASVGLVFFAAQMLRNENAGEYGDVMERALYNTVLAGTALDGKHFFYVNPLEVNPAASRSDPGKSHVKPVRPQWLGCACCPPNLARLLASVDRYIYTVKDDLCLVNLYISSTAELSAAGGDVRITQSTDYPRSGIIQIHVSAQQDHPIDLGLRIPGWSRTHRVTMDGNVCEKEAGGCTGACENGYLYLRHLAGEHEIVLELCMEPRFWRADPRVRDDIGKVALTRGPIVYCLEEADNGKNLHLLSVDISGKTEEEEEQGELGDIMTITAEGRRIQEPEGEECLYLPADEAAWPQTDVRLHFIPYYTWANRGCNEMCVWVRTT